MVVHTFSSLEVRSLSIEVDDVERICVSMSLCTFFDWYVLPVDQLE